MIPEELTQDLKSLNKRGFKHELSEDGSKIYIVFKDFELPFGLYNMEKTDLLIYTSPNYPNAGFDMFWVDESLTLSNGNIPKKAELIKKYLNKNWRRFSYHPYNSKPWNPSEDDVSIFIEYVQQRLRKGD